MDSELLCSICEKPLESDGKITNVQKKGLEKFIKKSQEREDGKWNLWVGKSMIAFHEVCRKRYSALSSKSQVKKRAPKQLSSEIASSSLTSILVKDDLDMPSVSSHQSGFNFSNLCFICNKSLDAKHKEVHALQHKYALHRLIDVATRKNDEESAEVIRRLKGIDSLERMKASYHVKCYLAFIKISSPKPATPIVNEKVEKGFQDVCRYIETSDHFQFSLPELQKVMRDHVLHQKTLFRKLKEKYGEDIAILQHRGRQPTIYYKICNISNICGDWFCNREMSDLGKKTILTVAAEILRTEITKCTYINESYPPASKFLDNVMSDVPEILTTFLSDLLLSGTNSKQENNHIKRDSIAHSIVSILRPNTFVSNLQIAIGTYIYRKTGSRLIIDLLSKFGICETYHNVQLYEASTIMDPPKVTMDDAFVQYVFDNIDHNVSTIDGYQTFHCLGGIAVYTPNHKVIYEGGSKKCKKMPSPSVLASQEQICNVPYGTFNSGGLKNIEFIATNKLHLGQPPLLSPSYAAYAWAKTLKIGKLPTWKGFLEILSQDTTYSISHVQCLPFINESPSQFTTLNTALHYAQAETRKLNQKICFVTFDQPLYFKARSIVAENPNLKNVVVRLGGFHLLKSYFGAIGFIMNGSGLEDLWCTAYTSESVKKMFTGHAYSRALRAHILSFTALAIIICEKINVNEESKNFIIQFFKDWNSNPPSTGDCNAESYMKVLTKEMIRQIDSFEKKGPTAKLWIQYFKLVIIALQFIEAECSGNWDLHLQSVEKMLPLFHASGHFACAKSTQMYLQDMAELDKIMDHTELHKFTEKAFFTIRRTDKAWSGVWGDMVIEQFLNHSFGSDLRHDRGLTSSVVARSLLGMPSVLNVMECLENYVGLKSTLSDLSNSRVQKDEKDITNFLYWLREHNPFTERSSLMSLSTGLIGGVNINCHKAIEKGLQAMELMVGENAENISLSAANKVKPLSAVKDGMHINSDVLIAINPSLLFQRISVVFQGNVEQTRNALAYELSPFPLSLFDEQGYMRKPAKAEIYKLFKTSLQSEALLRSFTYVIDGGWLLHRVIWPSNKKYKDIFKIYLLYIIDNFGNNSVVVFHGYHSEITSTKSYERYRRKEKIAAPNVEIAEDKLVTLNQSKFLSNTANKFKFVHLLSTYLQKHKINTKVASEDGDTLIINTAIQLKQQISSVVAVVSNNVDLFVLLVALVPESDDSFYFKMSAGKNKNVLYHTSDHKYLKPFILFAHAFAGCDTTSAIFGKEKKSVITLLIKDEYLQQRISVFYQPNKSVEEIYAAGENFIMYLYNVGKDKRVTTINELRFKIFTSSLAGARKKFSLASLPPTDAALLEHVKRVYYQIQLWLGQQLDANDWGWKRTNIMLLPVMTNKPAAPKKLLEMVFCTCQTNCNLSRCSCRKVGLSCTLICKSCNGESCDNSSSRTKEINESECSDEDENKNDNENENEDHNEYQNEDDQDFSMNEVDRIIAESMDLLYCT